MQCTTLPHQLPTHGTAMAGRFLCQFTGANGRLAIERNRRSPCVCQADQSNFIYVKDNSRKTQRSLEMGSVYSRRPAVSPAPPSNDNVVWLYEDLPPPQNGHSMKTPLPYAEPQSKSVNPALNNFQSQADAFHNTVDVYYTLNGGGESSGNSPPIKHSPIGVEVPKAKDMFDADEESSSILDFEPALKIAESIAAEEAAVEVEDEKTATAEIAASIAEVEAPQPTKPEVTEPLKKSVEENQNGGYTTFSFSPEDKSPQQKPSKFVDQEAVRKPERESVDSSLSQPVVPVREAIVPSKPDSVQDLLPLKERAPVAAALGLGWETEVKKPEPAKAEEPVKPAIPESLKMRRPETTEVRKLLKPDPKPTTKLLPDEAFVREHYTRRVTEGDVVNGAAIAAGAFLVAPYTVKPVAGAIISPFLQVVGSLFTVYFSVTTLLPATSRKEFQEKLHDLRDKILD